jgi:hypothetical protein
MLYGCHGVQGQFIEMRRYHLLPGAKQRAFSTFIGEVAIPAMNRAGVSRVGAFTVVYGENEPRCSSSSRTRRSSPW